MHTYEYIYIIHVREFIRMKENIYKIGKTKQKNYTRLLQYPKGSKLIFQVMVDNCDKTEKDIIKLFKEKFSQMKDYGNEYFKGNYIEMIKTITNYCFKIKNLDNKPDLIIDECSDSDDDIFAVVDFI